MSRTSTSLAALTEQQANDVYDVLVEEVGAREDDRASFVYHQTSGHVSEYRFMGHLGFGGKFWRNPGLGPDGKWGERWYVNYYNEHATEERDAAMQRTNDRLVPLRDTAVGGGDR